MPIASRFRDGTTCVFDGAFVASLVGGRWKRGLEVSAEECAAVPDEEAVMLAVQARAALGERVTGGSADLRPATL